jgi:hypothetical protein
MVMLVLGLVLVLVLYRVSLVLSMAVTGRRAGMWWCVAAMLVWYWGGDM